MDRLDSFEGTDKDYISYLEEKLTSTRQKLRDHTASIANQEQASARDAEVSLSSRHRFSPYPEQHLPTKAKSKDPQWRRHAMKLIDETPSLADWNDSLKAHGIFGVLREIDIVSCLLEPTIHPSSKVTHAIRCEGSALDRTRAYAEAAFQRGLKASATLALANFQRFLALSACAVLKDYDPKIEDDIFGIVRICVGKNISEAYCKRTLTMAKYLNVLIDTLYSKGWGYRATELLFFWNRAPSFYQHLSQHWELSLALFECSFATDDRSELDCSYGISKMPINVSIMVHHMVGGWISLDRISQSLGYKHVHVGIRVNAFTLQESDGRCSELAHASGL